MNRYIRLLKYTKPYTLRLVLAIICTVLASAGNLYIPWIVKGMIDQVLTQRDEMMLNIIALSIVGIYFARGVCFYGQSYFMAYVGQRVVVDIRTEIYRKLNSLSLSFYDRNKTGSIMSYVTNDVAALQGAFVQSAIDMFTEGVILIGSLVALLILDWRLALFTFLTVPAVYLVINAFGKKLRASGHSIQERAADITSVLQEKIASARVVKSFVREDYEINLFEQENHRNFRANMKNAQLSALLTPLIEFVAALGITLILWYGGHQVIDGYMTAGSLVAFLLYAVNMSNPIKRLTRVYAEVQRAMAAAQRVFSILDKVPDIIDKSDAIVLENVKGNVEFQDVVFEYNENEPVLNGLSFAAEAGKVVAFVGPSGAGKTTIGSLLPRFYDVTSGKILIDDIDIRDIKNASLREHIGVVPQETILFNGSVYDNILYGRLDATKEEVIEAARFANADSFIKNLPNGYDTLLGDRGLNLSGGQRQRISIARALLKNPQILVLDEATSALDTESEKAVQDALDRLLVGRTSFVIAHRLSTIQHADVILVLDKGKIVEQGNHESLLKQNGLYAKLYQAQFHDNDTGIGDNN